MPFKRNKVAPKNPEIERDEGKIAKDATKNAKEAEEIAKNAREAEANSSGTPLTRVRKYKITNTSQTTAKATAEAVANAVAEEIEEDLRQRECSRDECYHNGFNKPCRGMCTKCLTCHACKVAGQKLMCDFHLNQK